MSLTYVPTEKWTIVSLMDLLSFEDLDAERQHYDEAVSSAKAIDHFCSSSLWVLPAIRHLMAPSEPLIARSDGAFVAMARSGEAEDRLLLHPLEAMWGLPCPLVGADPDGVVDLFLEACETTEWSVALVTGLVPGSRLSQRLAITAGRRFALQRGPITRRYVGDLSRGVDEYLKRRSSGFRANLRKADRRADRRGIRFEVADEDDAESTFDRILAVEKRSWKGLRYVGIDREPMCSFYRDMNRRLVESGLRRLIFARHEGDDVAYIFGALFGDTYRGLQFSFDQRYASLSLGNLCQLAEIRRLVAQGIPRYDLGTEVQYKKRWGDEVFATMSLVLHPR
jgi:hypothetical protein